MMEFKAVYRAANTMPVGNALMRSPVFRVTETIEEVYECGRRPSCPWVTSGSRRASARERHDFGAG
jgi:hypothetical protein